MTAEGIAITDTPAAITTSNAPFLAADDIRAEHAAAQASAQDAIAHAIRCGQLLIEQRPNVGMSFRTYIERVCDIPYSTGKLYMRAARAKADGLAVPTLRSLYPSGRPEARHALRPVPPPELPDAAPESVTPDLAPVATLQGRPPTMAEIKDQIAAYAKVADRWGRVEVELLPWIQTNCRKARERFERRERRRTPEARVSPRPLRASP